MRINEMTLKDFKQLKHRKWDEDIGEFDNIIIIPLTKKEMHDSGYRCMDFVAARNNRPICLLSGCSDVLHINGIGGYGKNWRINFGKVPELIEPYDWNIDCLPKSGLLRLWCNHRKLTVDEALSSFSLYAGDRIK